MPWLTSAVQKSMNSNNQYRTNNTPIDSSLDEVKI